MASQSTQHNKRIVLLPVMSRNHLMDSPITAESQVTDSLPMASLVMGNHKEGTASLHTANRRTETQLPIGSNPFRGNLRRKLLPLPHTQHDHSVAG